MKKHTKVISALMLGLTVLASAATDAAAYGSQGGSCFDHVKDAFNEAGGGRFGDAIDSLGEFGECLVD
ncbi:MAG: hypothetical protein R3B81_14220 [bacterium]